MSQPTDQSPTPHHQGAAPVESSSVPSIAKNPSRPPWGRRILLLMFIVALVGPCVLVLGPQEIAAWHFVAAQEMRSAGDKDGAYDRLAQATRWSPNDPRW